VSKNEGYLLKGCLPRKDICSNTIFSNVSAGEHTANVAGRDLQVKRFNHLIPCFLAQNCIRSTVMLAKDDVDVAKVLVVSSCKSDKKSRLEFVRGNILVVTFHGNFSFTFLLHEHVIELAFSDSDLLASAELKNAGVLLEFSM
jgi:hypothetical protein